MRVLIESFGSHGDVLPFLAIGRELQRRGHEVRLYSNAVFARNALESGIHFTSTSPTADYEKFIHSPKTVDRRGIMRLLSDVIMKWLPSTYESLRNDVVPGNTLIICSTFAFAGRLLRESSGIPAAIMHLSPAVFRSEYTAPRFFPLGHMENFPRLVKRLLWKAIDRYFLDAACTAPFNRIRAQYGLQPVERLMHDWIHASDLTIGMFPEWFATPQPDWPYTLRLTGFPICDGGNEEDLPDDLHAFLEDGEAPVGFTAGTSNTISRDFYRASAEACRISGRRGILLTMNPGQIPDRLPAGVRHFPYAPFGRLLPRLAALVHHGGIGTTSQALAAGIPQLIRPMVFDQFDNSSRVHRLGVARELLPQHYQPEKVARLLDELIHGEEVKSNCRNFSEKIRKSSGVSQACDLLEDIVLLRRQEGMLASCT